MSSKAEEINRQTYRTKTHPHGCFVRNQQRDIGFVRISKCGSSTFCRSLDLEDWVPFDDADMEDLYCCLRDPFQRFLSSIPETLSRVTTEGVPGKGNVPVNAEIYEAICSVNTVVPTKMVHQFIDIIGAHGWFDAHHEPMTHFFLDKDGKLEIDPFCFPLNHMDKVIDILREKFPHRNFNRTNLNIRSRPVVNSTGPAMQRILDYRAKLLPLRYPNYFRFLDPHNPLVRLFRLPVTGGVCTIAHHQLQEILGAFYRDEILTNKQVLAHARTFVESSYVQDIEIASRITFPDMSRLSEII